tara:strand:- start:61 stop:594 length:534 start_codon:yes stop_codon:yes gene_type:complete
MTTHYGVDLSEPLLTQVDVVDDFFPSEVFSQVNEWFTRELHWFYNPYVNIEGDHPDDFQFQHVFLLPDKGFVSGYTNFLQPFFERIPNSGWIRIKANLRTKSEKVRVGGFHIDFEDCMTSIFYFNDNDGRTSFESGGYVKSVANRLITFPSNIRHSGSTCTDAKARFVLNLNYIPAD